MGANHQNEIKELCEIARPDYGLITNVGLAHLEGFGSFENIVKTKSELYDSVKMDNGKVFINEEDSLLYNIVKEQEISHIKYFKSILCQSFKSQLYVSMKILYDDKEIIINCQLFGRYNMSNIVAAFTIGKYFEVPENDIVLAIESYTPSNNRSQLIKTNNNNLFVDAYNANPSSMNLAIDNFSSMDISNKIAIIGKMYELGKDSDKEHYEILKKLLVSGFKKIYLVGDWKLSEKNNNVIITENVEELSKCLIKNPEYQSNILIKGSRANQLENIIKYL